MNQKKIIDKSLTILTGCYNHDIAPLMEAYDEECLWIGPAKNRMIRSKEKIREAYSTDFESLHYTIYDRTVVTERLGSNCLIVLFTYSVDILYPDHEVLRYNSRAELVWYSKNVLDSSGHQKRIPVLRIFQLSHESIYDARDVIHPVHIREIWKNHPYPADMAKEKAAIRDLDGSIHFFDTYDILWAESKGKHSYVHTSKKTYECKDSVAVLEKQYPELFFRCHSSYLINPAHVSKIIWKAVILSDGTKIPIPEKKYTAVKAALLSL